MGYEDSRFRASIAREFHCSICNLVIDLDFVMETRCNHFFCRSCFDPLFQHNHRCPVSGNIIKLGHLKRGALWVLAYWNLKSFKISCDYRQNGCNKIMPLGHLAEHVNRCSYRYATLFDAPQSAIIDANTQPQPPSRPQRSRQHLNVIIQERNNNTRNSCPSSANNNNNSNLRRSQSVFHIALEPSTSEESIEVQNDDEADDDEQQEEQLNQQSSHNYVSTNMESESVEPLISFDDDYDQQNFSQVYQKRESGHCFVTNNAVGELCSMICELKKSINLMKEQVLTRQEHDLDSLKSLEPHFNRLKLSLINSGRRLNSLSEQVNKLRKSLLSN